MFKDAKCRYKARLAMCVIAAWIEAFTNSLSDAVARIEPEASSCKITFVTKPDGSLSIEVLGPTPGDKISGGVGIPTKFSNAGK